MTAQIRAPLTLPTLDGLGVATQAELDAAIIGVTPWVTPALGAGWGAIGSVQAPRYRKVGDVVEVEGAVSNTTGGALGTTIFTLPAGFRPPSLQYLRYPDGSYVSSAGAMAPNASVSAGGIHSLSDTFSTL